MFSHNIKQAAQETVEENVFICLVIAIVICGICLIGNAHVLGRCTEWVKKTDTFAANLNNKGVSFFLLTLYKVAHKGHHIKLKSNTNKNIK